MRRGSFGVVGGMVLSLLVGTGAATAQSAPEPGDEGPDRMGPMGREARFLELTEEQVALVDQVLEQQRPEMKALHEKLRQNRRQLREALDAPVPDAQSVGGLVIEGERLRQQGRALREEAEKAIEGFLTPEQKRKREILEAARALSGPMNGPGPGFGPGPAFGGGAREGGGRRPR